MVKLTEKQDMKLGIALDQLDDALNAAYASLKMVIWAQVNAACFTGGILGDDINSDIRAVPLDVARLWDLARASHKNATGEMQALHEFKDDHSQKIVDVIVAHEDLNDRG